MQNPVILKFLLQHDIIWLLEARSVHQKTVPGFNMYYNKSERGQQRGGVVMLIRCALMPYVIRVDMETDDMIWLELSVCAGVRLGGVYVPPEDSLYCEASPLRSLNLRCSGEKEVIALGDFNARVGSPVITCGDESVYEYGGVKDTTVNSHGRMLVNMCNSNSMTVMNHLKQSDQTLGGNLSFRRGATWISEIDLCVVKSSCVGMISSLHVNQAIKGSDHAPLCVSVATQGKSHMTAATVC